MDLYTPFHKGIRKLLYELAVDIGRTDFRNVERSNAVCVEVRRAIELLREHGRIEDRVLHPAIEERDPGATGDLQREHDFEGELIDGLEEQIARLENASDGERPGLGVHLYRSINAFCSRYLDHLALEEEHLMPRFWAHFEDAELAELRDRAQSSLPPGRIEIWIQVAMPAFSTEERALMLEALRNRWPATYDAACAATRACLPDHEWAPLAERLGLPPQ